jgi:hypothetical protein
MKYALLLSLLIAMPCWNQSTTTGKAETTGPCSPAVSGNNNQFTIKCQGISNEQGAQFLRILNKISKDQLDPKVVMDKFDDIENLIREIVPKARHLSDQQKATLRTATASFPDSWIVVQHSNTPEAKAYAEEIKAALGSKVVSGEFEQGMTVTGLQVGAPYNDTELTLVKYASNLANAMKQGGFPDVEFGSNHVKVPITPGAFLSGNIYITVGFQPSAH